MKLSQHQLKVVSKSNSSKLFLSGNFGCGKTTTGLACIENLINRKIQPQKILILVPQRGLALPYYQYSKQINHVFLKNIAILTMGGLARRMISLFWPLVSGQAGFISPDQNPTFLSMETAQYFMSKALEGKIAQGYFDGIHLEHNRVYSQILDNLNKSAIIGFPISELAIRLSDSSNQDKAQEIAFHQVQECAIIFREYCLANRLLDYSLQMELFSKYIWQIPEGKKYLFDKYAHIIYDNVEEDVPLSHDLVKEWLNYIDSALLIYDKDGGYRSFLGADPQGGLDLKDICDEVFSFSTSYISTPEMCHFQNVLQNNVLQNNSIQPSNTVTKQFTFTDDHYVPEMIESAIKVVRELIDKNTKPADIVILAPYLSDSLLFSLSTALKELKIEYFSNRPSRTLAEEPVTKCLLTLTKIAHPDWHLPCTRLAFRSAIQVALTNMDLVRAELCSQILFSGRRPEGSLGSFDTLRDEMKKRITFTHGDSLEQLRKWLTMYQFQEKQPLFVFISRIFGELLSQKEFSFHNNFEASKVTAQLIESIKSFRLSLISTGIVDEEFIAKEYIKTIEQGLIASQFFEPSSPIPENAVFISPAFTFLMTNRSVKYQLWLDLGNLGWWERLNQPLTHPYLLNRHWEMGTPWTDIHEFTTNQQTLARLVGGLTSRCSNHLFLFTCHMNSHGQEQQSPLLQGFQRIFKKINEANLEKHV